MTATTTPLKGSSMLVQLKSLTKTYRAAEVETTALSSVNVDIREGEFVAVMGPSGCGKSTLLNVIGMLDSPTAGSYLFKEQELSGLSEARLAALRKRHLGFVFQSFNLIDELTVEGNIELALLYHKMSAAERKKRVTEVMDRMKIAHRAKHFPSALSGGQQQRVAVARAVAGEPVILLADEPTGNLDSKSGEAVMELLRQLYEGGATICMVTHDPRYARHAGRNIHLFDGRVVSEVEARSLEVAAE